MIRTIIGILATTCIFAAWIFVSEFLEKKMDDNPVRISLAGIAMLILVASVLFASWHWVTRG